MVRVRAQIDGRLRTIDVVRRTLEDAATIHPHIHLNRAARQALATHGRLVLRITTRYSQTSTRQTIRTTLTA